MTRQLILLAVFAGLTLAGCSDDDAQQKASGTEAVSTDAVIKEAPAATPVAAEPAVPVLKKADQTDATREAALAEVRELRRAYSEADQALRDKQDEIAKAEAAGDQTRPTALRAELDALRDRYREQRVAYTTARDKLEATPAAAD